MVICLLLSRRLRVSFLHPMQVQQNGPICPPEGVYYRRRKQRKDTSNKTKREAGLRGKYGEGRKKKGKEKENFTEYRHRAAWRKGEKFSRKCVS